MKTKRVLFALVVVFAALIIPFTQALTQDTNPTMELTGVNPTGLPEVLISANVTNSLGQPILGLGIDDFALSGELAQFGTIVDVQNIRDDNLPFAVVLVIDTSSSVADFITQMREAAIGFVSAIGDDVSVALLAFNSEVRLIRDYSTDRAALISDIENLPFGGQTALYQASFEAVEIANRAPYSRRAIVMLSDGGEFGGFSTVERGAAVAEAQARGVSVYTIGLGYDFDRSYLLELAEDSNAGFYESPTGDQLAGVYDDIATVLRSQYVITLQVDVPADGTEYPFTLTAATPDGTASADGVMRAPIPVPIIRLPDAPAEALTELTTFTADVIGDDQPLTLTVNGEAQAELPFTLEVDPQQTAPGTYTLEFTAADADGDSSSATFSYEVAALPSSVRVSLPEGELTEPTNATIEVSGQTPVVEVVYAIDGGEAIPAERVDAAFAALITPFALAPGEHTLNVTVTNEGGVTSTNAVPFTVAVLPPVITVSGLEAGQTVDAPVTVQISVVGQTPLGDLAVGIAPSDPDTAIQTSIPNANGANTLDYALEIDPYAFPPGAATLAYAISDSSGGSGNGSVDFTIAELPIEVLVEGLTESETISEDREISIDFRSQTPVVHVAVFVDSEDLAHLIQAPFQTTIRVLDYAPGPHLLRIIADTADGRQANFDLGFIIDAAPSVNATGTAVSVQATTDAANVQATNDAQATTVAQATVDAQATTAANATATASAQQSEQQATQTAVAGRQQATQDAASTLDAVNAQSTQTAADAQATRGAYATSAADAATAAAQTGVPQQTAVAANAQATRAGVNAQATVNAADAQATNNAQATVDAANAQATNDAQATLGAEGVAGTSAAQTATADFAGTGTAQANADASATAGAAGTSVAQASVADATATAQAELLIAQTGTADALAANAQGTATSDAAGTATEQAAVIQQTSTAESALTQTAAAQPTATPTPAETEEATAEAQIQEGTPTEQPTLIPEVGDSTQDAGSDLTIPLVIACVVLLIILLVVWLLLAGRRRSRAETRR